jgi:hypothetical protein
VTSRQALIHHNVSRSLEDLPIDTCLKEKVLRLSPMTLPSSATLRR